jgi:hypothetical protein
LIASIGVVGLVVALAQPRLRAAGHVEYTWSLVAIGQGGWIGGPLFEDGTVGGGGAISLNNGKILADLNPTGWTENDDEQITVCFDVIQRKGPAVLPSELCFGPADVTTPVHVNFLGIDHIFRITEIR